MAYADALNAAVPADTDPISQGDDAIRTQVRALRERLESVFQDIDADPMVLKAGSVGSAQLDSALGFRKVLFGSTSLTLAPTVGGASITTPVIGAASGDIVACNYPIGLDRYIVAGYAGVDTATIVATFPGDPADAPGGSSTISFAVIKQ